VRTNLNSTTSGVKLDGVWEASGGSEAACLDGTGGRGKLEARGDDRRGLCESATER